METIQISYATLRRHTEQVREFVQKNYWWEDDTTLTTALENDLGITGDDAVELLIKFEEEFGVNWQGLNFTQYFTPEGVKANLIGILLWMPILAIQLTFFSGQLFLALLVWPFATEQANWIVDFSLRDEIERRTRRIWPQLVKPPEETFNVGDLVAAVAAGRFVKREQVRFGLI